MQDAHKIIVLLLSQLVNGFSVDILSGIHKYTRADKIIIYVAAINCQQLFKQYLKFMNKLQYGWVTAW